MAKTDQTQVSHIMEGSCSGWSTGPPITNARASNGKPMCRFLRTCPSVSAGRTVAMNSNALQTHLLNEVAFWPLFLPVLGHSILNLLSNERGKSREIACNQVCGFKF